MFYVCWKNKRYMDDLLILSQTRWQLRGVIRKCTLEKALVKFHQQALVNKMALGKAAEQSFALLDEYTKL
jgi:hypothetical protein